MSYYSSLLNIFKKKSTPVGGGLILWNKLENDSGVSEVGDNLIVIGTNNVYSPAKFGNGYDRSTPISYSTNHVNVPADIINGGENCIEFYYIRKNTITSFAYLYYSDKLGGGVGGMNQWIVVDTRGGLDYGLRLSAGWNGIGSRERRINIDPNVIFPLDVPVHIAIVRKIDGWMDLYLDGILQSTEPNHGNGGNFLDHGDQSAITYAEISLGTITSGTYGCHGIIDNLKIYDYAKTDFSDRNSEDGSIAPTLWNKLEDDSGVSEVGDNLIVNGTNNLFGAGKFGQALDVPSSTGSIPSLEIPSSTLPNMNKFTVELWYKRTQATTNGNVLVRVINTADTNCNLMFQLAKNDVNSNGLNAYVYMNGASTWCNHDFGTPADPIDPYFPIGQWIHLALTRDSDGTFMFYKDGVALAPTNYRYPASNTAGQSKVWSNNLYIGKDQFSGQGCKGLVDNIKVYDYVKTDFSDRNTE